MDPPIILNIHCRTLIFPLDGRMAIKIFTECKPKLEKSENEVKCYGKNCFFSLGVMGYPMARHLATAGHKFTVQQNSFKSSKMDIRIRGSIADTPHSAVKDADFVMSCVGKRQRSSRHYNR